MPRLDISNTSLAGIAGLLIIIVCLTLLILGRMDVATAALAIAALSGAASKVGLFMSKDSNAPDLVVATEVTNMKRGTLVEIKPKISLPLESEKEAS